MLCYNILCVCKINLQDTHTPRYLTLHNITSASKLGRWINTIM